MTFDSTWAIDPMDPQQDKPLCHCERCDAEIYNEGQMYTTWDGTTLCEYCYAELEDEE